ncbi:MAG: hypothetical protein ACYC8T_08405 [Myxococcaceae bacterium]
MQSVRRRTGSGHNKVPQDPDDFRSTIDTDDEEPVPDPIPPPRRRTGGVSSPGRRRTASGSEMPPAPPPVRSNSEAAKGFQVSNSAVDRMVDVEGLRERSRQRLKRVLFASVAVAALAMGLVFRGQIWDALTHTAVDGQGIYLTVSSNPKAKVVIRHAKEEAAREPETELGETPLNAVRGAHIRDTLILTNPQIGLYYEEEIKFGEPNKVQKFEKEFAKGSLKLVGVPQGVTGLSFWRGTQEVGRYAPGLKIELYEGPQRLEVRGNAMKRTFEFEVQVKPGATVERTVDLSGYL